MPNFLDNLKKAVDTGDFNSEAASKINEISKLAENKSVNLEKTAESIEKRVKENGKKETLSKEKMKEAKIEYEKKMTLLGQQDFISSEIAALMENDKMTMYNVLDMLEYINKVEEKTKKLSDVSGYDNLSAELKKMKEKYNAFINH